MTPKEGLKTVQSELESGIALLKCRKCGCMEDALMNLAAVLPAVSFEAATALASSVRVWHEQMQPTQYACLGCEYCYPAVAQNAFTQAFPTIDMAVDLSCDFRVRDEAWPPVVGEYYVLDGDASVAVSTLASAQLAGELAQRKPDGLSIVGKTETENIGIDKVIKNVITSTALRYLIVAGKESDGHYVGQTLLALAENGIDERGRVIGSVGKRPVLRNVSAADIRAFREQVQVVDMIGCEVPEQITDKIAELASQVVAPCGCSSCSDTVPISISTTPVINVSEPVEEIALDKAGYFVILPLSERGVINVEHYAYDNQLLRVIKGATAREIYYTLISNGWVTELSHAAYLGKELVKAELSLQHGFTYVQDGA
jgi:tetrahydromethanopterin S-methyltransferase subunit A